MGFEPKKDGLIRFLVDYTRLNAEKILDSYPMPNQEDCMESLGNASVLSNIDSMSVYWKINVRE